MEESHQANLFTPYEDINDIIIMMLEGLKDIFAQQLKGIYLTGSLTYGGFDRSSSDIDFLVVLHNPFHGEQRRHVKNLHDQVAQKHPLWAKRIECSYITADMLQNINPPSQPRPYVNGGQMWEPDPCYGNEWLINLYALYACGIALYGPKPEQLIGPVDINLVRKASLKDLHEEWKPKLHDPSVLADSHHQAYAILTLCRILHRAKNDNIASKQEAAAWVKKRHAKPWSTLIEKAESWGHGQELDALEDTLDFIRFVIKEAG